MEIKGLNFSLTKETQIYVCTFDFALSNCYACNNRSPKRSVVENKMCVNWKPQLNMKYVAARVCVRS